MLKSALERLKSCRKPLFQYRRSMGFNTNTFEKVPQEKADCVVIGAGIVGIAVARALAQKGRQVLVIEAASTFGTGTSSRNSEVIHAGIYYPTKSFKALFCVQGRELLYKYCSYHEIPHKRIGKLIVATRDSEVPKLEALLKIGIENGVEGLKMIDGEEAMQMERELQCIKALWSPCTGIVDSHSLMLSMVGEAESYGTSFSYNTAVIGGHSDNNGFHLHVVESKELEKFGGDHVLQPQLILSTNLVVNSAGLSALSLSRRFHGLRHEITPASYYARGCYFTLSGIGKPPFNHLIYPLPEDGGIGVHVTLDMNGQVRFGPDVEWLKDVDDLSSFLNKFDYSVDANRAKRFYPEIKKYYPNLKDGSLEPGYAGIRPKLCGPGKPPTDFLVQGEDVHGVPGLVNLFGIESPGLTSSMAIAEYVVSRFCG
ncbi:hypothetical protein AMTRI_Chr01g127740 [Amborella trichopoda]|uniref:L-2-hydroxyglutarate dehydrogenase, mitochondrial n=1 Tax=Amborella trichopoda TaxID=13333 RepID=W1NU25_AMBTC|nr:L-2-hydroxyglutarate dehydrogenase, mitochondrial [Amborella trichopoda]ERM98144.1 hypothetical protein AMTR_s00095p00076770 [Amborella trichopoda]|eukprot:XP_006832866.1 L-2-hydroxyglutarate dehydrogenase, mitochondrial [Amborella trichopoda]